jgi:Spy/CpxP family protein refolding chaperone
MKEGFESLGRVRFQGIALLAIAFAAGVLGGMAVERVRFARMRPPRPPTFDAMHRTGELPPEFDRLNLTSEQRGRIEHILQSAHGRTDSILQQSLPRLAAIHDSVRAEIRALLTPEQQRTFDELAEGPFGRRGPGGPGPGGPGGPMGPPPRPF